MGGRRPGRGEGGHESGPKGRATAAVWAGIGVINNQDLDGLVALYAPDATMVLPDGSTVTGTEAIRE